MSRKNPKTLPCKCGETLVEFAHDIERDLVVLGCETRKGCGEVKIAAPMPSES